MNKELEFQKMLKDSIVKSQLSVSQIYWILKDTYRDVEQLYMQEIYKQNNSDQTSNED